MKKNNILTILGLLFLILILVLGGYFFLRLILSESVLIHNGSLKRDLLIPYILRDNSLTGLGRIKSYYYSAADGVKPIVTSVSLIIRQDRELVKEQIRQYFFLKGFEVNRNNEMIKENLVVSIEIKNGEGNSWVVTIALLEHLEGITLY